jgi:hypothetical protein
MKRDFFKWLVFEAGGIVAGFVFADDAAEFVEQCGSDSMEIFAAGEKVTKSALRDAVRRSRS